MGTMAIILPSTQDALRTMLHCNLHPEHMEHIVDSDKTAGGTEWECSGGRESDEKDNSYLLN